MNNETPSTQPTNTNWQAKIKGNKTPLLIALLAILTVFLVLIAIAPKKVNVTPPPATEEEAIVPAETILSMESASSSGSAQSVNVMVDSGANTVTGVQLELSFDPKLITNVTLTPGEFITNPVELLKNIDYANGRVSYVLGIPIGSEGVQGTGTVAKLSYREVGAQGETVSIKFLPKTLVASEGFSASALKEARDYSKAIGQPAQ